LRVRGVDERARRACRYLEGGGEGDASGDRSVTRNDLAPDCCRLAAYRDVIKECIVNERGHLVPAPLLGEVAQSGLQRIGALGVEHRRVRRGRCVECDLGTGRLAGRAIRFLVGPRYGENLNDDAKRPAITLRSSAESKLKASRELPL